MFRRPLRIAALVTLYAAPARAAQAPQAPQAPRIAEVQIAPPFVRMVPDAQVQASATAYDSAGTPVVVRFRWSSSNINVATVSENGMVRGVATGTALVMVTFEGQRGGRRRAMQVQVMPRAGSGTSVGTTSMPPMPPMAPGMTPGMAPAGSAPPPGTVSIAPPAPPATMVYVSPHAVDSTVKASINCNEPMLNAVNPLNACYDQRPTPRVPPVVTLPACSDHPSPNGVLVMVRVLETGAVAEVMPFVRGGCEQLIEAATQAARGLTFNPALRDGHPVSAWARIVIRNTEPPPKQ